MFKFFGRALHTTYTRVINSLAYYPVLIALALGLLSLVLITASNTPVDKFLEDLIPALGELEGSAARELLSVVTAGSISITVFSFSMVMLVLSQAASVYSPKILDGLIKDKRPQRIMGLYIGTVVYCLPHLLLSSHQKSISTTAVVVAISLAIANMFVFISFIHFVSQSIKPGEICRRIFKQASHRPYTELKLKRNARLGHQQPPDSGNWLKVNTLRSGYFQDIELQKLYDFCEEEDIQLHILHNIGDYLLEGMPLVAIKGRKQIEEELESTINRHFLFYNLEDIDRNPYYAYRQLSEVAVKAMSPGINDIGTTRIAIDYLTDLIAQYVRNPWFASVQNGSGQVRLWLKPVSLQQLFELCFDEIRNYSQGDKFILLSLLQSCRVLLECDANSAELETALRRFSHKIMAAIPNQQLQDIAYLELYYDKHLKQSLG